MHDSWRIDIAVEFNEVLIRIEVKDDQGQTPFRVVRIGGRTAHHNRRQRVEVVIIAPHEGKDILQGRAGRLLFLQKVGIESGFWLTKRARVPKSLTASNGPQTSCVVSSL